MKNHKKAKSKRETFDLAIFGAGSVGCAIFFDACLRGLKTCLIEKGFAGRQTNAASLGIVHRGGLNYLSTDLDFVRMSATDCEALCNVAGNMLKKQKFIIPVFKKSALPFFIWDGILHAYDHFAFSYLGEIQRHKKLNRRDVYAEEPFLKRGAMRGISGGVSFEEFMVDPVALSLAMIKEGEKCDGKLFEQSQLFGFKMNNDNGRTIKHVYIRNSETKEETVIEAKYFINATGPWAPNFPKFFGLPGLESSPTRGTSIILDCRLSRNALVLFKGGLKYYAILPWGESQTLVGPTNHPVSEEVAEDPDKLKPEEFEIDELLEVVSSFFSIGIKRENIVEIKCGIRPQLKRDDKKNAVYRFMIVDHLKKDGITNFCSVFGGKLTNQLRMAKETVDFVLSEILFEDGKLRVRLALRLKLCMTPMHRLGGDKPAELSDDFLHNFYLKEYALGYDDKAGNRPITHKMKLAVIVLSFMIRIFAANFANKLSALLSKLRLKFKKGVNNDE